MSLEWKMWNSMTNFQQKRFSKFDTATVNFSQSSHDELRRCAACSLKYTADELQLFGGRLICRYCINDFKNNIGRSQ